MEDKKKISDLAKSLQDALMSKKPEKQKEVPQVKHSETFDRGKPSFKEVTAESLEQKEKRERARQMGTPEWEKEQAEMSRQIHNCCWKCMRIGLTRREYFLRKLVAWKKVELETGESILPIPISEKGVKDSIKVQEAMRTPYKNGSGLFLGQWPVSQEKLEQTLEGIRKRFHIFVQIGGYVQLCPDCAKRLGYDMDVVLPKVDVETLMKVGPLLQAVLNPGIQRQAENELAIEAEQQKQKN